MEKRVSFAIGASVLCSRMKEAREEKKRVKRKTGACFGREGGVDLHAKTE